MSSTMMKALQIASPAAHPGAIAAALKLVSIPRPTAQPGHVVVKNAAIGTNFIEAVFAMGHFPGLQFPLVPGIEGAGTITEIGANVTDLQIGDRIAWQHPGGGYAEFSHVPAAHVYKLPASVSTTAAAQFTVHGMTVVGLTSRMYKVAKGDWVLVQGASGGVASGLIQRAAHLGAHVITTTTSEAKADAAKKLGAKHVIRTDVEGADVAKSVLDITGGRGVDVVYDGIGQATFRASLGALRTAGHFVSFGTMSGPIPAVDLMHLGSKFITFSNGWDHMSSAEAFAAIAGEAFGALAEGTLTVKAGRSYAMDQAVEALLDCMSKKGTGKVVIEL